MFVYACVRVCVRSCVRFHSVCFADSPRKRIMKVYIDRNNIPVEVIQFRKKNSDFIAVVLEVGKLATDVFMKFVSLLSEVSPPFGEELWA